MGASVETPLTAQHTVDESDLSPDPTFDPETMADSGWPDVPQLAQTDVAPRPTLDAPDPMGGGDLGPLTPMPQITQPTFDEMAPNDPRQQVSNDPLPAPNAIAPTPLNTGVAMTTAPHPKKSIRQQGPQTAMAGVNIFAPQADAGHSMSDTNKTTENIFRNLPRTAQPTDAAPTELGRGDTLHQRDVTPSQITKRYAQHPQTSPHSATATQLGTVSNLQSQPTGDITPDNVVAMADDPADLAKTILRDLGPLQTTSAPQTRTPVIAQLAHALPHHPPQGRETYDVDLTPKDLGRVRMTLTPHDGGITITILCDVDSTAQLARRNSDHLVRDLMDMGYASVDIDVAGQQTHNRDAATSQAMAHKQPAADPRGMDDAPMQQGQMGPRPPTHRPDGIDVKV